MWMMHPFFGSRVVSHEELVKGIMLPCRVLGIVEKHLDIRRVLGHTTGGDAQDLALLELQEYDSTPR
jgi:hypothetical protein